MKCPECGAQTCTHALDAMEDYAAHALAMEETVDSLRSRAEAAESERDAARKERDQIEAAARAQSYSGHDWNRLLNERDAARAEAERLREALRMAAQLIAPLGSDSGQERWDLAKKLRALTPSPSPETKP